MLLALEITPYACFRISPLQESIKTVVRSCCIIAAACLPSVPSLAGDAFEFGDVMKLWHVPSRSEEDWKTVELS